MHKPRMIKWIRSYFLSISMQVTRFPSCTITFISLMLSCTLQSGLLISFLSFIISNFKLMFHVLSVILQGTGFEAQLCPCMGKHGYQLRQPGYFLRLIWHYYLQHVLSSLWSMWWIRVRFQCFIYVGLGCNLCRRPCLWCLGVHLCYICQVISN